MGLGLLSTLLSGCLVTVVKETPPVPAPEIPPLAIHIQIENPVTSNKNDPSTGPPKPLVVTKVRPLCAPLAHYLTLAPFQLDTLPVETEADRASAFKAMTRWISEMNTYLEEAKKNEQCRGK
jgi:hypothetical protein